MTIENSAWNFLPSYYKNGNSDNNSIIWRFTQSVTIDLADGSVDKEIYDTAKSFLRPSILVESGVEVTFIGITAAELSNKFLNIDVKPKGAIYYGNGE